MATAVYGLRARKFSRQRRDEVSAEDFSHPAAAATIAAGLRPKVLTKAELLRFRACTTDYLEARNLILLEWEKVQERGKQLTVEACTEVAGKEKAGIIAAAHRLLQQQGCINTGLLPPPAAAATAPPVQEPEAQGVSDEALAAKVFSMLKTVDMQVTTEKMIRKRLQEELGVADLSDKKLFIRSQVEKFLAGDAPPTPAPPAPAAGAEAQPEKKGKVVVVGAGPAGLAAALHLQRNGVEVVVLEARARAGGRVHTYTGDFAAPVDLGASIITGTQVDAEKQLRADPSALVCRQLGIELHPLSEVLPLSDGVTGRRVAAAEDAVVEALRDELMDAARQRVEDLGEEATEGESLGDALERAFAERFPPPSSQTAPSPSATFERPAAGHPTAAPVQSGPGSPSPSAANLASSAKTTAPALVIATASPATANGTPGSAASAEGTDPQAIPAVAPAAPPEVSAMHPAAAEPPASPALNLAASSLSEAAAEAWAATMANDIANALDMAGAAAAALQESEPLSPTSAPHTAPANGLSTSSAAADITDPSTAATPPATATTNSMVGQGSEVAVKATISAGIAEAVTGGAAAAGIATLYVDEGASGRGADPAEASSSGRLTELTPLQQRLLDWHWANLEYGCSAELKQVSLPHWNQDEEYGGFGGPHCMVPGGYAQVAAALAAQLDLRLSTPVARIADTTDGVEVTSSSGDVFRGDAVVVTVPLGCLKAGAIAFEPPLPSWKLDAIQKLGYGNLNKVVLQFPSAFWDVGCDYFGAAVEGGAPGRGRGFMFWNLARFTGQPILTSLLSGAAATQGEKQTDEELRDAALAVLRRLHGADIPQPTAYLATRWAADPFARGSYSYVAVGASAKTYDQLALPVRRRVLFAGEHTCKEHPDTVGGAMLSGQREAVRVLEMVQGELGPLAGTAQEVDGEEGRENAEALRELFGSTDSEDDNAGEASQQKKRKRRKDGEEGRKKKRKDGGNSGEEGSAEREERIARGGAAAMGRDVERIMREQVEREAARADRKAIWRALLAVTQGDAVALLEMMAGAVSAEARQQLAAGIQQAEAPVRAAVAGDRRIMAALAAWLRELLALGGAAAQDTLDVLLKCLAALPVNAAVLTASGLEATLRRDAADSVHRDGRKAAAALLLRWFPPASNGAAAAAAKPGAPHANGKLAAAGEGARQRSGSGEAAAGAAPAELVFEMPEHIAAAEEAAREAQLAAGRYAEEAARLEAEVAAATMQVQLPDIDLFQGHRRASNGGAEGGEPRKKKSHKLEKLRHKGATGSAHKPAGGGSDKPRPPPGSGPAKQEVCEYVKTLLKPLYNTRRITKDDFKWVIQKTSDKVVELSAPKPGHQYLSEKRKQKIRDLVDKYIKQRTAAQTNS